MDPVATTQSPCSTRMLLQVRCRLPSQVPLVSAAPPRFTWQVAAERDHSAEAAAAWCSLVLSFCHLYTVQHDGDGSPGEPAFNNVKLQRILLRHSQPTHMHSHLSHMPRFSLPLTHRRQVPIQTGLGKEPVCVAGHPFPPPRPPLLTPAPMQHQLPLVLDNDEYPGVAQILHPRP